VKTYQSIWSKTIVVLGFVVVIIACNTSANPGTAPTPSITVKPAITATPTITIGDPILPSAQPGQCDGLSGNIEMQVLIGPAEVVGLEPLAIGSIPFSVTPMGDAYVIEGGGSITYQDVLEKEWGTYTVEFDLQAVVSGSCQGDEHSGELNMAVETNGEQFVEVEAEGYYGEFPWAGSHEFNLSFPIEEGSEVAGEGWAFVLHLNK
jgi:hypothetical protein